MVPPQPEPKTVLTPEPIMRVASGFMASKHLFAAGAIDLFATMADGPKTLAELSKLSGVPPRTVRITADAMVALGFLEKHGDRYQNSPVSDEFLAGKSPSDLRPFLKFWDRISYPNWMSLEQCIRTAKGVEEGRRGSEEEARIFSEGVAAATAGAARSLLANYDWSVHQRVLDIGGGTGSFLSVLLNARPELHGTLMELPETVVVARRRLATDPASDRIAIVEGSCFEQPIPRDHDAVIVSNVVHVLSPEHNLELFRRIRAAVTPSARLLLIDFWLNPAKTEPVLGALMSGEFLVLSSEGESYSEVDAREWLEKTGWKPLERRPLTGPFSLLIAEAN